MAARPEDAGVRELVDVRPVHRAHHQQAHGLVAAVVDAVRALAAAREGRDVAGRELALPVHAAQRRPPGQHHEQLLVGVVRVQGEGRAAGRHLEQRRPELARPRLLPDVRAAPAVRRPLGLAVPLRVEDVRRHRRSSGSRRGRGMVPAPPGRVSRGGCGSGPRAPRCGARGAAACAHPSCRRPAGRSAGRARSARPTAPRARSRAGCRATSGRSGRRDRRWPGCAARRGASRRRRGRGRGRRSGAGSAWRSRRGPSRRAPAA